MSTPTEPPEPASRLFQPITHSAASPTLTRTHTNGSRTRRPSTAGPGLHRAGSHVSHKETRRDPELDINLPYRTMTNEANLEEYTKEDPSGEINAGVSTPDGKGEYKLVTFLPNDPENPKNWSKAYKWYITMIVALTCFVVAFASSVVTADIVGVQEEFNVSEEVALLSITLFVVGFGIGTYSYLACGIQRHMNTSANLLRSHGIRSHVGSTWSKNDLRHNALRSNYFHHSLRRLRQHHHSSRLQSDRWNCILSTNHHHRRDTC